MKKCFRILLVVLTLSFSSGCQTKPKSKPVAEMSDAELVEMYKYGAVEKPADDKGFPWSGFFKGVGAVILYLPLCFFSHAPVDRGA
jgi:hypothetical protein